MKIREVAERECCQSQDLENMAFRKSKCKMCGQVWSWYKTLDESGNWCMEREKDKG